MKEEAGDAYYYSVMKPDRGLVNGGEGYGGMKERMGGLEEEKGKGYENQDNRLDFRSFLFEISDRI